MSIQYLIYKNVMCYQMARFYKEPSVDGRQRDRGVVPLVGTVQRQEHVRVDGRGRPQVE